MPSELAIHRGFPLVQPRPPTMAERRRAWFDGSRRGLVSLKERADPRCSQARKPDLLFQSAARDSVRQISGQDFRDRLGFRIGDADRAAYIRLVLFYGIDSQVRKRPPA